MIYISQGHEKSIGLEILLKSLILIGPGNIDKFILTANKATLLNQLSKLNVSYSIGESEIKLGQMTIQCKFIAPLTGKNETESSACLQLALQCINNRYDILLTMPTTKDQLVFEGKILHGYTEFFRKKFNNQNIAMLFQSPTDEVLLITDHLPLTSVPGVITSDLILSKIKLGLDYGLITNSPYCEVVIAGINPHAGENGLLGTEDIVINKAVSVLKEKYPDASFIGPISADTLSYCKKPNRKQLFVYMYHDQALPMFKGKNHFIGLNVTLGLPFIRATVDHGTAFDKFGANNANYTGCAYMLNYAISLSHQFETKYSSGKLNL